VIERRVGGGEAKSNNIKKFGRTFIYTVFVPLSKKTQNWREK
jgi:hypothetical protein